MLCTSLSRAKSAFGKVMLRICWYRLQEHRTPLAIACFADKRMFAREPNEPANEPEFSERINDFPNEPCDLNVLFIF